MNSTLTSLLLLSFALNIILAFGYFRAVTKGCAPDGYHLAKNPKPRANRRKTEDELNGGGGGAVGPGGEIPGHITLAIPEQEPKPGHDVQTGAT